MKPIGTAPNLAGTPGFTTAAAVCFPVVSILTSALSGSLANGYSVALLVSFTVWLTGVSSKAPRIPDSTRFLPGGTRGEYPVSERIYQAQVWADQTANGCDKNDRATIKPLLDGLDEAVRIADRIWVRLRTLDGRCEGVSDDVAELVRSQRKALTDAGDRLLNESVWACLAIDRVIRDDHPSDDLTRNLSLEPVAAMKAALIEVLEVVGT